MAGITVLPARSIRVAPAGAAISPLRPMRVMVPRSARMALFSSTALPSPVIRRAPSNSMVCAVAGCAKALAASAARPNQAAVKWDIGISPFAVYVLFFALNAHCALGAAICTGLFALDVELAHHACVVIVLALHVGSEVRAAAWVWIERLKRELRLDLRRLNCTAERVDELRHRAGWRLRRCHE